MRSGFSLVPGSADSAGETGIRRTAGRRRPSRNLRKKSLGGKTPCPNRESVAFDVTRIELTDAPSHYQLLEKCKKRGKPGNPVCLWRN